MKIQYCSDLHLEFEQNNNYLIKKPLKVCGDILVLAGDIVPLQEELLKNPFFSFISDQYKQVFWVPGNHEYYNRNIAEYSKSFNMKLRSNINIVNNITVPYENFQFVFSTLWSKISSFNEKIIEQRVSDFECIYNNNRKFKAKDFNKLHLESLQFINQSLSNETTKTVVVTHHSPSSLCNSTVHNSSAIKEAFCSDLTEYIKDCNANFWIYGHSHFNQKPLYIGNTIMLTNQLGYVKLNEHRSFKNNAYFSI